MGTVIIGIPEPFGNAPEVNPLANVNRSCS